MSYYVKGLIQKAYEAEFSDLSDFVVMETKGITGNQNNEMRGELLKKGIRLRVVKNALMRRTLDSIGHDNATDLFHDGPCTIAYGGDSVVDLAKELLSWAKKIQVIEVKSAYVEGTSVDKPGVVDLSKMPTRAELQGQISQMALTPGSNIAGAIVGPGGVIAGCIKSLIEKLEEAA